MASYHFYAGTVSAINGHSATGAAAYQANEKLEHYQQRVGSIAVNLDDPASKSLMNGDKRILTSGQVSDNLRQEFQKLGISLSENVTAVKDNQRQWTVFDGDKQYIVKEYRETTSEVKKDAKGNIEKDKNGRPKRKQTVVGKGLDIYQDRIHDYRTKEDVLDKWIKTDGVEITPDSEWVKDRQMLWNQASSAELRRDGVEAIKLNMTLLRELSLEENRVMLEKWLEKEFTSKEKGAICDVAIHRIEASDSTPENPLYNDHAHILVTTRKLSADGNGFANEKNPELDSNWQKNLNTMKAREKHFLGLRKSWADIQNQYLWKLVKQGEMTEQEYSQIKVDHRSLIEQKIDRKPEIHMGEKAWNAEKNGYQTKRGDRNEERKEQNRQKEKAKARKLEQAQKEALPKEKNQSWWRRVARIFPRHKPIDRNQPAEKKEFDWRQFLFRQWSWEYSMNAAIGGLNRIRPQNSLVGKPIDQQEKKQIDREKKEEIEQHIKKELAKHLPKQSHLDRVQQQGEHHEIKR